MGVHGVGMPVHDPAGSEEADAERFHLE
jgi:hypothetical protein